LRSVYWILSIHACFVAEEKCHILPRSSNKNPLHEALANERFEDASRFIASQSEAQLVECFEGVDGCLTSCLHVIAAMSDTDEASKLCRQLMQKIKNAANREYLLNTRTIEEFDMGCGWTVHAQARVAAIHIAAYSGNSGVLRLLCEDCGVDVNCSTSETFEEKPKKGMTALEWAARKGHAKVVKVLLDNRANVNMSRPTDSVTPLFIAAQSGHVEVVKLLLNNKADVNASRHTDGCTPAFIAAQEGHVEVVKLLLDNKAYVNARCTDDYTALLIAAQNGHGEVVKLLLDNKADVNVSIPSDGATSLHIAAQKGHVEVAKLLLDNKADVNASRSSDGTTPLYITARNGYIEIVKLLLANEANVNARLESSGDKPIDAARQNHHLDIVKLLQ